MARRRLKPAYRFYRLYDKIYRPDILEHAYALARDNDGAPGVDGVTFEAIEASGVEGWLAALREDVAARTYRPQPVRRVMIPKPGGGERPLGIPTIRDRVVQTAANPRARMGLGLSRVNFALVRMRASSLISWASTRTSGPKGRIGPSKPTNSQRLSRAQQSTLAPATA